MGAARAIVPAGKFAPAKATQAQLEVVERLVLDNVATIGALEPAGVQAVLPVLKQVRDELRRDLASWLAHTPDGAERYTAQQMRVALRQVEAALAEAAKLEPAMAHALDVTAGNVGSLAIQNLETEIARFGSVFGDSIRHVQIDTAAVIARGDKLLIHRFETSAARYAGGVAGDIRQMLAVGVARGETFAQLKARLVRHGGPRGMIALRGKLGDPHAVSEWISEGLFARYRFWAERVVRTEVMHAYNLQHQIGIDLLNQTRDPGSAPYLKRWDATPDRRTCPMCGGLDARAVPVGQPFPGGIDHPPAHPLCRCVEVAWHESWGGIAGERASRTDDQVLPLHAPAAPPIAPPAELAPPAIEAPSAPAPQPALPQVAIPQPIDLSSGGPDVIQLPPPPENPYTAAERAEYKAEAVDGIRSSYDEWKTYLNKVNSGARMLSERVHEGMTYSRKEFYALRNEYVAGLNNMERDAGLYYSHEGDRVLNSALRYGLIDNPEERDTRAFMRVLDRAIGKFEMPKDVYVSRGMKGDWAQEVAELLQVGDVFQEVGYTSTAVTEPFPGEVKLRIKLPKGFHAAPIPSRYAEEDEFLLPRGTRFRVLGKTAERTKEGWQYMIDLEALP